MSRRSMKTVVVLHPHFTIAGGAGKFVLEVGSRLADRGFSMRVVCIRADPDIVGPYRGKMEFVQLGGPLSSSFLSWLAFPWLLIKMGQAFPAEPFVLFPQVFPANWWGFIYKLCHPGTPLVWMCHEPSAFIHSRRWRASLPAGLSKWCAHLLQPLLKPLDIWLAHHANRVYANSRATQQQACDVYHYAPEHVRICYPGVDSSRFHAAPAPGRKNQIVTVGRLTRFKNIDLIVRAVGILKSVRSEPVRLKIVGKGEEEAGLRRLVQDLDLDREVDFCGAVGEDELVHVLQESRAFLLASVGEPFGIATVEAMACGVPCVVDGSGGPAETVVDGVTGFHVHGPDPATYAEKVRLLLDDERLFRRMSEQALAGSRRYDWERTAAELAACFEEFHR